MKRKLFPKILLLSFLLISINLISQKLNNGNKNLKVATCFGSITGLKVVDTSPANVNVTIVDNGSYDINSLPAAFRLEATITGTVGSIKFDLTGSATGSTIENAAPYNYPNSSTNWAHGIGSFTMTIKAYSASAAGGILCDTKVIHFSITNNNCDCANNPNNLIKNSSFQNATFNEFWSSTNGTLSSNTTYRACGDKGIVLDHTSGTASIWQKIDISANLLIGSNITFSAYAGTHAAGQSCDPKLFITYYKADNSEISSAFSSKINRNVDVAPVNVLEQFSVTGTIPLNTAYIKVGASITCDFIKFDAACLSVCKYAGVDGTTSICDNSSATIDLNALISGENTGGTWTKVDGTGSVSSSGTFTPAVGGGASTVHCKYTVTGYTNNLAGGNCTDESIVTITISKENNLGQNKTVTICDSDLSAIDLFSKLDAGYTTGGTWTQAAGSNGSLSGSMFTPVMGDYSTILTYTVAANGTCPSKSVTVTVVVKPHADAGTDGTYEVCDNSLIQINLNDYITGEQSGGTWTLNGNPIANPFTPSSGSSTNTYIYTVSGSSPCSNDQSQVIVTVYPSNITVEAGPNGEVCAHLANQQLEVKTYQLAGSATGAASVLWSDGGAGGSFDDATKLNAIYTPPIGGTTITLTLTSNDPAGPCGPVSDFLTLKEIACAGILDPCTCNQVTYNPNEIMEVKDFIEIDGTAGDQWIITVNGGGSNPLNSGAPYGTMQQLDPLGLTTTNIDFPIGTIIPAVAGSPGLFRLDFAHDSGKGYTVTVKNTVTGQELSISNYCIITTFTPNFSIGSTICSDGNPVNLASLITDGTPADSPGVVDYYYIDQNGIEQPITTAFNPALYPTGTVVQIFGRYTPNNVIDCQIIRKATNQFTVVSCVLPLTLLNFAGKVADEAIALNWKTADEKNFSHFEVQKSSDSREYGSIGKIMPNANNLYNFKDLNPFATNNYYRLKMVNIDGTYDVSNAININFDKNKNYVSVENPSKSGEIILMTNIKNPSLALYTSSGSKIETSVISNGENKFVIKPINYTPGLYFLNVIAEGKLVTKKIIIP